MREEEKIEKMKRIKETMIMDNLLFLEIGYKKSSKIEDRIHDTLLNTIKKKTRNLRRRKSLLDFNIIGYTQNILYSEKEKLKDDSSLLKSCGLSQIEYKMLIDRIYIQIYDAYMYNVYHTCID